MAKRLLVLLLSLVFISGCAIITYDTTPGAAWSAKTPVRERGNATYQVVYERKGLNFGGPKALERELKNNLVFKKTEKALKRKKTGTHIEATIEYDEGGMGWKIWGIIAAHTAFILPAWTESMGFIIRFHIYENGKEKKWYEYGVYRKGYVWLPFLIVGWVNFFTDDEEDGFKAVTRQFFKDAVKDGVL